MPDTAELVAKTRHLLPDLDELEARLAAEPETILTRAFPATTRAERTRAIIVGAELATADERMRRQLLEAAQRAVSKIRLEGVHAPLEPEEAMGYHMIFAIESRPALLIQEGRFSQPPPMWAVLEELRSHIERVCQSVGRIEVPGHHCMEWVGTGFLVAEDVVMTNGHVAREFCTRRGNEAPWVFEPGIFPRIDYSEEKGTPEPAAFALTEVIGVHEQFDLALFRVSHASSQGQTLPVPLPLAAAVADDLTHRQVYVVGYPALDSRRNDPELMRRIFHDIYDVKRLQPGEILEVFPQHSLFYHDCSTLGGNSGSCVIDLGTNQVIGLHFGGRYLEANKAVALWRLHDDPLLRHAGVHFV